MQQLDALQIFDV